MQTKLIKGIFSVLVCALLVAQPVAVFAEPTGPGPSTVADDCHLITDGTHTMPDSFAVSKCLSTPAQRGSKFLPNDTGKKVAGADGAAVDGVAANGDRENTVATLLIDAIDIFVKVIASLSLVVFILGAVLCIVSEGKDERLEKGKNAMLASVIGLGLAMFSFIIVALVQSLFFTS